MTAFALIPILTLVSVVVYSASLFNLKTEMAQATLTYFDQATDNQGRDFSLERFYDLWHWCSDPTPNPAIWAPGTSFSASARASFQIFLEHIQILINFARMGDLESINPRKRKIPSSDSASPPKRPKLVGEATVMTNQEFKDFTTEVRLNSIV